MANSMPFNSVNSDRVYKAEDWAWYFSTFIKNGVFPDPSDGLKVVADSGMNLKVKPGFAFIHGYAMRNPDEYVITIDTADGAFARIDRVVVRLDHVSRDMYIHLLKGTVSDRPVAPDITRDAEIHDIVLADVTVMAGTTAITNANITDRRFDKTLCGIVTGTVEEIDPSTLTLQFETYFNEFKTNFEQDMDVWKNQQQADVESWLQSLYGALTDDEMASLLLQIETLKKEASPLWVDGKTLVLEGGKIRADQPYINVPTATTSWKLSSHVKPGVYDFKILAGVSTPPQDAPGWFAGRTDFCLEVVPFNGDGTNGKGIVLQRFSGKEYRNGITNIRESVRLVDVGAVESGTEPEEWTDIGVYKATMLATESVGKNPQTAVINLSFKSEEYSIAKGSTGLPTEDDYIVLTAGGETNSTGAQILVREKDGVVYTRGRHGGGWKSWNRTVRYEPFKATGGISGPQYIPIGFLKYSAPGSGYVYGGLFDLNVYGSMEGGGYGVSHLCISIVSHNGNLKMSGSLDYKMSNFDIIAVRGDDDTSYRLYIRTTYGGTSGEISLFSNAGNDVSLSIGAGSADSPSGLTETSLSNSIIYGNVEVISSIRDVKTLYAGTASVDGGAVTLTDSPAGYKTLSFACFNGQDRHTGILMCDALEAGVQYVVPAGTGYIKFSFAGDQFTLISNTVGANLHRIYGKK